MNNNVTTNDPEAAATHAQEYDTMTTIPQHCPDHDNCLAKIHDKLDQLVAATCGGTDTIGMAEQIRVLEKRVDRLDEILSSAKKGVWDLFQKILPWLLLVMMAGLQAKGVMQQKALPAPQVLTAPLPQNVGNTVNK